VAAALLGLAAAAAAGAALLRPGGGSPPRLAALALLVAVGGWAGWRTGAAQRRRRAARALQGRLAGAAAELLAAGEPDAVARVAVAAAAGLAGGARAALLAPDGAELAAAGAAPAGGAAALTLPLALPARAARHGSLRVVAARPLPAERRDALRLLAAQVTLALEAAALEAERRRLAQQDALTGLVNRGALRERLGRLADRGGAAALLVLGLDDFGAVNDWLGRPRGDEVLAAVAARIRACLRGGDTAARLGGDEFAVLLDPVGDEAEALAAAGRLLQALAAPVAVAGRQVRAGASVGLRLVAAGQEPEELLDDAHLAMRLAKRDARGGVKAFDAGLRVAALHRLHTEADLRRAVAEQQFTLRYQPIVELAAGRLVGLEALVRWQHPTRGLVDPTDFIDLAEQTGLIVPLGRFVLQAACQAARDWQRRHPLQRSTFIAVNLSVRQLLEADLLEDVAAALEASGLPPAALMLEITESVLAVDAEVAVERLWRLRELGVHLAVDDFGTGYSSLAYLRRLPVDTLKVAKPFVDGLRPGSEESALVGAIVGLADALSLRLIAEGIERPDQALELGALGCRYGQGHLFARPVDQLGVERLLRAELRRDRAAAGSARSSGG
jgi:diguanylate cyclase (GGDEF)-like protein